MNTLDYLNGFATPMTAPLLNSIWQGTVLTVAVWLILRAAKRVNATTRHAIWWATLGIMALLTGLSIAAAVPRRLPMAAKAPLPHASVPKESLSQNPKPVTTARAQILESGQPQFERTAVEPLSFPLRPNQGTGAFPRLKISGEWPVLFLAAWAMIAGVLLVQVSASILHLSKLKRHSFAADPRMRERFEGLLEAAQIRRRIGLRLSADVSAPAAVGLWKPAILLPAGLIERLDAAEIDQILLHEAAHLSRWDDAWNLGQQLLRALLWPHPAVQWICARLNLERELACDDWVLCAAREPKAFARCLVKLAELLRGSAASGLAPEMLGRRCHLSRRIEAMLRTDSAVSKHLSRSACLAMIFLLPGALWVALNSPALVCAGERQTGSAEPKLSVADQQPDFTPSASEQAAAQGNDSPERIAMLRAKLNAVVKKKDEVETMLSRLEEAKRSGTTDLTQIPLVAVDPEVQEFMTKLELLEVRLAESIKDNKLDSSQVRPLEKEVEVLKKGLGDRVDKLAAGSQKNLDLLKAMAEDLDGELKTALNDRTSSRLRAKVDRALALAQIQLADGKAQPELDRPKAATRKEDAALDTDQPVNERDSILEEIRLAQLQLKLANEGRTRGQVSMQEVLKVQRDIAALKRELAAYDEKKNGRRDLITDLAVLPTTQEERQKNEALRQQVSALLLEMVKRETNAHLRASALQSFLRVQTDRTADLLTDLVLKDEDPDVRKLALIALVSHPSLANTQALLKIYDQLSQEDEKLKLEIIFSLGRDGSGSGEEKLVVAEKAIAKLQEIAKDSASPKLQAMAIAQLGVVGQALAGSK